VLGRTGELLVLIRYTMSAGLREWWLVHDESELVAALERAQIRYGRSDAVELHVTEGLVHRGNNHDSLQRQALSIVETTDVVMACRRKGDAQLRDVFETDDPSDIAEWFAEERDGQILVLPHPLLAGDEFYPDVGDRFLAYAPLPSGDVKLGAY
jgi:hypothetical protein